MAVQTPAAPQLGGGPQRDWRQRGLDRPPQQLAEPAARVGPPLFDQSHPAPGAQQIRQVASIRAEQLIAAPAVEHHMCSLCPTRLRQRALQGLIERLERLVAAGGARSRAVEERDVTDVQPADRRAPGLRDGRDELVLAAWVSRGIADRHRQQLPFAAPIA